MDKNPREMFEGCPRHRLVAKNATSSFLRRDHVARKEDDQEERAGTWGQVLKYHLSFEVAFAVSAVAALYISSRDRMAPLAHKGSDDMLIERLPAMSWYDVNPLC